MQFNIVFTQKYFRKVMLCKVDSCGTSRRI
jgi:hypothetical protein